MLSRVGMRRMTTAAAQAGRAISGPDRSNFYKMKFPVEAVPLVVCVTFACSAGLMKLGVDAMNPDTHFMPAERATMDYIENDRSVEHAQRYAKQFYHVGPFSDPRGILGIKPSI